MNTSDNNIDALINHFKYYIDRRLSNVSDMDKKRIYNGIKDYCNVKCYTVKCDGIQCNKDILPEDITFLCNGYNSNSVSISIGHMRRHYCYDCVIKCGIMDAKGLEEYKKKYQNISTMAVDDIMNKLNDTDCGYIVDIV